MEARYNSITILMGPPGSGKTTIGKRIGSLFKDVVFVSVGEYMRTKMNLSPPFLGLDHGVVFKEIINKKLKNQKDLIIDCNPFPEKMWSAITKDISSFKTFHFFCVNAKIETLRSRLSNRKRGDHPKFSDEDRLNYYFCNVEPAIQEINHEMTIKKLRNETENDFLRCVQTVSKLYEK